MTEAGSGACALARCASIPVPPASAPTARSAALASPTSAQTACAAAWPAAACRCSISRSREISCSCCARMSARSACCAGRAFEIRESQTRGQLTCAEYRMNTRVLISVPAKKVVQKNLAGYTDNCGSHVRTGRRQSMPSSSIDSCARVSETVPLAACGHTKRPRSSRLANRHKTSS